MSHGALVAVPSDSGGTKYDVYHSRNGADGFKLYPLLDSLEGSDLTELHKMPHQPPQRQFDVADHRVENVQPDDPLIYEEPLHTDTTIDDLLSQICYISYDALYVVDEGSVSAYYLSWGGNMMHSLLAANGTLEIHSELNTASSDFADPYYRIDGDAFLDLTEATQLRSDAPPVNYVEDVLSEAHMGIFRSVIRQLGEEQHPSVVHTDLGLVYTPNEDADFSLLGIQRQFGVCIDAEIGGVSPDLVWSDFYERANKLRWDHMMQWNDHFLKEGSTMEGMINSLSDYAEKNRIEFGTARANLPEFPAN